MFLVDQQSSRSPTSCSVGISRKRFAAAVSFIDRQQAIGRILCFSLINQWINSIKGVNRCIDICFNGFLLHANNSLTHEVLDYINWRTLRDGCLLLSNSTFNKPHLWQKFKKKCNRKYTKVLMIMKNILWKVFWRKLQQHAAWLDKEGQARQKLLTTTCAKILIVSFFRTFCNF